jgi:hypothetical protein
MAHSDQAQKKQAKLNGITPRTLPGRFLLDDGCLRLLSYLTVREFMTLGVCNSMLYLQLLRSPPSNLFVKMYWKQQFHFYTMWLPKNEHRVYKETKEALRDLLSWIRTEKNQDIVRTYASFFYDKYAQIPEADEKKEFHMQMPQCKTGIVPQMILCSRTGYPNLILHLHIAIVDLVRSRKDTKRQKIHLVDLPMWKTLRHIMRVCGYRV